MRNGRLVAVLLLPFLGFAARGVRGDDEGVKPAAAAPEEVAKFLSGWAVPEGTAVDATTGYPRTIRRTKDGAAMVLVPAGTFQMGAVPGDAAADADESPRHAVKLSSAYYLDETEVTVAMWKRCVADGGVTTPTGLRAEVSDALPMGDVSWNDVQGYLRWAQVSLPTEAQWERAAKAGHDEFVFPWGAADEVAKRSGSGVDGFERLAVPKSFPANDYGLFDMSGNVWEWCRDGYDKTYYASSPAEDPAGPASAPSRVIRGGAWYGKDLVRRVSYRDFYAPTYAFAGIGFRCARSLSDRGASPGEPPAAPTEAAPAPAPAPATAGPSAPARAVPKGVEADPTTGLPKWIHRAKDGATMLLIPAGTFPMGAVPADAEAADDEKPRHEVTLSKAYYLDEHEVTNAQFEAFVTATGHKTAAETEGKGYTADDDGVWKLLDGVSWKAPLPGGKRPPDWAKHPVVLVSWSDAKAYAEWAEAALPTEAQFERALRGGREDQKFPWGTGLPPPTKAGNFADESAKRAFKGWTVVEGYDDGFVRTAPARSLASNEYGLYGLSGNVWEWCADGYDKDYYAKSPSRDPLGADGSASRVARGGSWFKAGPFVRASVRAPAAATVCGADTGFRCARTVP